MTVAWFLKCKFLEVHASKTGTALLSAIRWLCCVFVVYCRGARSIQGLRVWVLFVLMDFADGCNISAPPAGGGMVSSLLLENIPLGRKRSGGKEFKADLICGVPTKKELMAKWTLFPASSLVYVNALVFNSG